jgi:hypothetical protein
MTAILKRNLEALNKNIEQNTPIVEQKYAQSGVTPDRALVFSTAKYLKTIRKLASE